MDRLNVRDVRRQGPRVLANWLTYAFACDTVQLPIPEPIKDLHTSERMGCVAFEMEAPYGEPLVLLDPA